MSDRHAPSSAPTHDDVLRLRPDAPPPAPRAAAGQAAAHRGSGQAGGRVADHGVARAAPAREGRQDKRERILQVVAQTGYASNPHARALRSGQSSVVAAFVSNIFSQQFALAVQGCAEVLEPQGYQLMVGQTSYSYAKETSMIASLRALPAAVLFTGVIELEENRQSLRELGIPIMETWAYPRDPIDMLVGLSTTTPASWRPAIWPSAATGAWRSWPATAAAANCAARASRRGRQRGLEVVAELAVDNPQTIADGRAALARLLSQGGKFDAVFCANDLLAVGAMFEARDRKLAVPRDLAVLGFGETDIAGEIQPGLTTIGVDSLDLGRRAGEMLLQRLGGGMPAHPHQVMPLRIHARASVDPPSGGTGARPGLGICLPDRCPIFRTAGKPMHDERPLLLRAGRPERRLRARRPGAGHTKSRLSRRIALLEKGWACA